MKILIKTVKVGFVIMHEVRVNGTMVDRFESREKAENCCKSYAAKWSDHKRAA